MTLLLMLLGAVSLDVFFLWFAVAPIEDEVKELRAQLNELTSTGSVKSRSKVKHRHIPRREK